MQTNTYMLLRKKCELISCQFVWANGRAARIGRAIPVCSIGSLPILEALLSLPLNIWQSQQSFRKKMVETANENQVEEWSLLI